MTRGIAPLILGYQAFDRDIRIGGVILNRVGGARHEAKLRAVIEHYTDVPVLGAVGEDARLALAERHLGLSRNAEIADAARGSHAIGEVVGGAGRSGAVLALAASAGAGRSPRRPAASGGRAATCASASRATSAFGFYYPDDLAGAARRRRRRWCRSTRCTMRGCRAMDGLFIGGGFPEADRGELEANVALRARAARGDRGGLPAYAECGGLMYLSRAIAWHGRTRAHGRRDSRRRRDARAAGRTRLHAPGRNRPPCPGRAGRPWRRRSPCTATNSTIPAWSTCRPACASRTACDAATASTASTTASLRAQPAGLLRPSAQRRRLEWPARFAAFVRQCPADCGCRARRRGARHEH